MHRLLRWLTLAVAVSSFLGACSFLAPTDPDQAALQALRKAGSDLTKPHPFDFYVYHSDQPGAAQICDQLAVEGFQTTVREGAVAGEWLCLANQQLVPTLENLSDMQSHLSNLAGKYGGEYDGWETVIVP